MNLNKRVTTALTTLGAMLSLGTVACADTVITVKPGDTLCAIARENNISIQQLQKENGIQNPNIIVPGQKIKITPVNCENDYVIVKSGDTLSELALENGTTVSKLQSLNHLPNINNLMPGQKILVKKQNVSENLNDTQNKINNNSKPSVLTKSENVQAENLQNVPIQQSIGNNNKATPVNNTNMNSSDAAAKRWIAQHESGNNYNAINGQYIGKYQLSSSYLHGNYSPENQEKCADQYVSNRYGNWVNAQHHWETYGWY